jgi:VRR-NUC domain
MSEIDIQNQIRIALSDIAVTFRANVGVFFTKDGRPLRTGLPKGFSDLFGFRKSDGRAFFLEIKTETGKLSGDQKTFLAAMERLGAISGVATSPEEAIEIITKDETT